MFKIVTFADVHLADQNPINRKDNYLESILDKLDQIRLYCLTNSVDMALCAGDLFDKKTPTKNSHYLVARALNLFKSFPCPVYTIIGNHDLQQDNINTLIKQPINTLIKSEALKVIDDNFFSNGDIRIFCVPYYLEPDYPDFNRENKGEKIQICVSHVNASDTFSDLFGERVYTYQELANTSSDIFVFGHYHPDQSVVTIGKKQFINVGAISRGSLKKDELSRVPKFSVITIDSDFTVQVESKPLKVLPASEIFDLEKKQKEIKEEKEIETFIMQMKEKVSESSNKTVEDLIKDISFEKSIKDKALFYYENAQ